MEQFGLASELDNMKLMFIGAQPWLLLLTITVSVVHLLFDFLAFKVRQCCVIRLILFHWVTRWRTLLTDVMCRLLCAVT